jgi:hypothetical protein
MWRRAPPIDRQAAPGKAAVLRRRCGFSALFLATERCNYAMVSKFVGITTIRITMS